MNADRILDSLETIDGELIEHAGRLPRRKRQPWGAWAAAAACFCLILGDQAAPLPRDIGGRDTHKAPERPKSPREGDDVFRAGDVCPLKLIAARLEVHLRAGVNNVSDLVGQAGYALAVKTQTGPGKVAR